jgi:hypothetical protein
MRTTREVRSMFDSDCSDAAFHRTAAAPRLGPPALTAGGMTFICEDRFAFDQHNAEFQATGAQPRLLPPVWRRGLVLREAPLVTTPKYESCIYKKFCVVAFPDLNV